MPPLFLAEMIDQGDALTFGASGPFIALFAAFVLGFIPLHAEAIRKLQPLVCLIFATAWGLVLHVSELWDGTLALFIVTAFTVGGFASAAISTVSTFAPGVKRAIEGPSPPKPVEPLEEPERPPRRRNR